jgi:hypothetical protein
MLLRVLEELPEVRKPGFSESDKRVFRVLQDALLPFEDPSDGFCGSLLGEQGQDRRKEKDAHDTGPFMKGEEPGNCSIRRRRPWPLSGCVGSSTRLLLQRLGV